MVQYNTFVLDLQPVILQNEHVVLEPMSPGHEAELIEATKDGELWNLWFTTVPAPDQVGQYIQVALAGQEAGHMLPWVVREKRTGKVVGSTRYHDIVAVANRVEIGYTWYSASVQRSHINTACKLLLLSHGFDSLRCDVVGLRTDNFNFRSQRAIEALGAKKDGVIRHHTVRKDGSVRDTVMYSILKHEWPDVQRHLKHRLARLETR